MMKTYILTVSCHIQNGWDMWVLWDQLRPQKCTTRPNFTIPKSRESYTMVSIDEQDVYITNLIRFNNYRYGVKTTTVDKLPCQSFEGLSCWWIAFRPLSLLQCFFLLKIVLMTASQITIMWGISMNVLFTIYFSAKFSCKSLMPYLSMRPFVTFSANDGLSLSWFCPAAWFFLIRLCVIF